MLTNNVHESYQDYQECQALGVKRWVRKLSAPRTQGRASGCRRSNEDGAQRAGPLGGPASPRSVELRLTQEATLPVSRPLSELFFAKSEVAFDRFDFCAADKDPVLEFQIAGFFVVFGFRRL